MSSDTFFFNIIKNKCIIHTLNLKASHNMNNAAGADLKLLAKKTHY